MQLSEWIECKIVACDVFALVCLISDIKLICNFNEGFIFPFSSIELITYCVFFCCVFFLENIEWRSWILASAEESVSQVL